MQEGFKKSDIEILVSTMNRDNPDFLIPMFPFAHFSKFSILVINQTTKDRILESPYPSVRVINVFEKGLSKSRNTAIENAIGKIGLLTDDDVVFLEDFNKKIAIAFNRFKNAAVVKFCAVTFEGKPFRKYPKKPFEKLNALQRLNTMSIEIAFNTALIKDSGIKFDEFFGLGGTFPLGEEPIFVNKMHDAGYKFCFEPEVIVSHKEIKDSDLINVGENYRIRGAYLKCIFKNRFKLWLAIQLFFNLKNGVIKPGQVIYCIKQALKGKNEYLSLRNK